ncbi:MAG: substrate-binding domain-containing protein [Prevotella sp.]|nr:substrate-binding domain-containing protein [Prevotella sp.]
MKKLKELPAAYFLLTAAVLAAAPTAVFYIMYMFAVDNTASTGAVVFSDVFRIALYFVWGRFVTPLKKPRKPQTRAALYFTALVPLFATVFMFLFGLAFLPADDIVLILVLLPLMSEVYACAFFGTVGGLIFSVTVQLLSFGAFAAGVRVSDRLYGTPRAKARIFPYAAFSVCFAAALLFMGHTARLKDLSTVTAEDNYGQTGGDIYRIHEGHGFDYEGGWSSVDLYPYYVENPENKLARLDEPSDFVIADIGQMPVLNGAEAAYPIYSAFAACCYENIGEIQKSAKENGGKTPVRFTNTVEGFEELLSGETDIFFGSKPSEAQYKAAEEKGKELVLTPIGSEAFIFFVNSENPVDGLTSEQIRKIYSGEIKNWRKVGGANIPVLAFQRPEGSGSQARMERFMGDVPLKEPLKIEYEYSMVGVIKEVASYQNKESAIGYSFRYYASKMFYDDRIKFLAVDGVYPDADAIRDGSYPLSGNLYAVTLGDNANPMTEPFLRWMTGEQGRQIVNRTGYIA